MSEAKLQTARAYIDAGNYQAAQAILETMPDNHTAQRWLRKLAERLPPETQPQSPLPFEPLHQHRLQARPPKARSHTVEVLAALVLAALIVGGVLWVSSANQQEQAAQRQASVYVCSQQYQLYSTQWQNCVNAP